MKEYNARPGMKAYKALRDQTWRKNNKKVRNDTDQHRYRERMTWMNEIKAKIACTDCKAFYPPVCMDWDHPPGVKKQDVHRMVSRMYSCEKILMEISKCELVCANCHRYRTFVTRKHLKDDK